MLQNYKKYDERILFSLRQQDAAESVGDSQQGRDCRILPVKETSNQHTWHEGSSEFVCFSHFPNISSLLISYKALKTVFIDSSKDLPLKGRLQFDVIKHSFSILKNYFLYFMYSNL